MRTLSRVVVMSGLVLLGLAAAPDLAAAGGGGCRRAAFGPIEGHGTTVELVDFCMSPSVLRVEPGAVVTFANGDDVLHNVVGSGMSSSDLAKGDAVAFRFDHTGTYAFACTLHPGMVGAIAVGDGRRTAPATQPISPVEVRVGADPSASAVTTLASAPVAARRPGAGGGFPTAPAAIALLAVAITVVGVGVVARRRRTTV